MSNYHYQCVLVDRTSNERPQYQIAWIPEKFAVEGKHVRLKDPQTRIWSDNWYVVTVYHDTKQSSDYVQHHRDDYKDQRKASDI